MGLIPQDQLDKFIINKNDSIREAMEIITLNHRGAAMVVDENKVIGVLSDGDIRRALLHNVSQLSAVSKIMNTNFVFTTLTDTVTCHEYLQKFRILMLPILDDSGSLRGIFISD